MRADQESLVHVSWRHSGVAQRQAQSAFLCGTSNCNLDLFIAGQREAAAEEFVSEPNTSALPCFLRAMR
jgi:hypothetical protein